MTSNYPPGVTRHEEGLSSPDYETDLTELCPKCGQQELVLQGHHDFSDDWVTCNNC